MKQKRKKGRKEIRKEGRKGGRKKERETERENLCELWDTIKRNNQCIIGDTEEWEK